MNVTQCMALIGFQEICDRTQANQLAIEAFS